MPDRIIKESICTSDTLNQLTDFEERFWHRLTVNCDDYGRYDARPAILKGRLFPLMDGKTQKNMIDALDKLASVGLIDLYQVDGRPFLHVVTWDRYQRIRAKRSKFPAPDSTCCQATSNVPVIQSNPIQSNPNPNPNAEYSAEPLTASAPVITLPLNDKTEYPVSEEQYQEWAGLYPAVDVIQQLRGMRGWLLSNPTKRKTRSGIQGFITRWLAKEQDKGGTASPRKSKDPKSGYYGCTGDDTDKIEGDLDWMDRYLEEKNKNERENEP